MKLLHQKPGDIRCGAFAIAYLRYIRDSFKAKDPNPIEEKEVQDFYNKIKFGDEFNGTFFEGFSDPVKMIDELRDMRGEVSFYVEAGLLDVYKKIKTLRKESIPSSITIHEKRGLPVIGDGDFFIAVINVGTHYTLYYRREGKLYVIDPANGDIETVDNMVVDGGMLIRFQ